MFKFVKPTTQKLLEKEFVRYLFVGGAAFIIDAGVLVFSRRFLFFELGETGLHISTALGFIAGLIFNYILSVLFVFKKGTEKVKEKQILAFIIFTIIGIIGLGLTELGMTVGTRFIGMEYDYIVKSIVAAFVLIWNYVARKILIFK